MFIRAANRVGIQPTHLSGDLWGGLAAMLVALPSAIAFGVTIYSPLGGSQAASGAVAGILGATALGLVAPIFGGSSRLITAPCAPAAAVLSALAITFTQEGTAPGAVLLMLALIGLLAGAIQIGLGMAGIGRLIKYIPFPVVSGYLSGVGLIIIGSQIPKWMGAPAGTSLIAAFKAPGDWNWRSMLVGAIVIATMVLVPRLTKAVPAAILALLAGILAYLGLGLIDHDLMHTDNNPMLVGTLASGEGSMSDSITHHWAALTGLGLDAVTHVLAPALTLAVLLSIDTLKTCLVIDAMTNSHHDSDRELVGQGLGNIASSLVGGIPGAGTMGASLINVSSGGTSRLAGLMTGVFSLVAFLVLSPLIAWVPVSALAAILIVIGARMIDRRSLSFFFSPTTRLDFVVILSVILVAIFGNLIAASGVGVALAILLFIREQTRSSVVRHRIEGEEIFSKRSHGGGAVAIVGDSVTADKRNGSETVVFELQGSLFFGTANQLQTALEPETANRKYVVLSMYRVQSLDVTATHVLEQIKDRLEQNNAYLVFCDIPKGLPSGLKMKRFLKETGVVRPTEKAVAFRQLDEALEWIEAQELQEAAAEMGSVALELKNMPMFAKCSASDVAALESVVFRHSVKAGKRIFKAGGDDRDLFLIRQGRVRITIPLRKKDNYHMTTSGAGELIGSMGFIESRAHVADATALVDTEVYVLTPVRYAELVEQHPAIAMVIVSTLAKGLSSRLRSTIGEVQALRG